MVKTRLISALALVCVLSLPVDAQKTTGHVKGTGHGKFGTGAAAVNLSKTTLSFGSVTVNTTSPAQVVTLTNTGTLSLAITSIVTTSPFANTTTCTGTLAAGSSCTISVTFHPTSAVAYTGTTTITDNAQGSPHVIALNGLGGAAAAPIAQLSATSINFPGQQENTTSQPRTVTLTNSGSAVLNITSIMPSGAFADTTACGSTLAASASCNISVTFTPTSVTSFSGSITIVDDAADTPQVISLSGTGVSAPSFPVVNLSASSLAYGNQIVGSTSAAQVLTLTNVGTAALTISSIVTTGNFSNTTTCGGTLAAGSNCTISVTFSPLSAGALTGATTITDDASGSPHVVSLSGTGVTPTPPTTLFQDDFETGNFSKWGFQNNAANQSIVTSPVHGGTYSAKFHYGYTSTGAQDQNVWAGVTFTPSTDVFVRAYLFVKTPNAGETANLIVQRKLIWLSDSSTAGNNLGTYQVALTSFNSNGGTFLPTQYALNWISQATQSGGACGSMPSGIGWNLATLSYDTWYSVEFEVTPNTPGGSDGQIHLWINGNLVYSKTGISNLRGTCTGNISQLSLGEQANITVAGTVDQDRFWDDVKVSSTGPIGP